MQSFCRFTFGTMLLALGCIAFPSSADAQNYVFSVTTSLGPGPNSIDRFSTAGGLNPTNIVPTSQGITGASSLIVGPGGSLYVSSRDTNTIYRINPAGVAGATTTYANLTATTTGPAGLAFVGNSLYVNRFVSIFAPANSGALDKYDISGGTPVFQSSVVTNLNQPSGIGVGPTGSLFISNVGYSSLFSTGTPSGAVTRYEPSTNTSLTFIPTFSGGLAGPTSAKIGPDGKLWVVDIVGFAIRRYEATTGAFINNFTTSFLDNPSDIVFDDQNRVWVANLGDESVGRLGSIERFDLNGTHIDTVANSGYYAQLAITPEPAAILGMCSLAGMAVLRWKNRRSA